MNFKKYLEETESSYENIKIKCRPSKDAWGKSNYTLNNQNFQNYSCEILDTKTGGIALINIGAYFDNEKAEYTDHEIKIVSWNATPLSKIAEKGLVAQNEYKGKGFGRNVMSKIMEMAIEKNISILSIFAPSDDSQKIIKHYTSKGLLSPITSSKAEFADYYTSFYINKTKAMELIKKN